MRKKAKLERDAKGHFLPGNQESVGNSGHAPCHYCQNKEQIMKDVYLYEAYCNGQLPDQPHIEMPYLEELCLRLKIHTDTLANWVAGNCKEGDHSDIIQAYKRLFMTQKLRLMQRMGSNNPTGSIFLLKANHNMVETEKRLIAGVVNEPLEIVITEETPQERGDQND